MGADIHLHIEYKAGDKPWEADEYHKAEEENGRTYVDSFGSRNYALFANLAGVRGRGPEPKGLPDDVTEVVKIHSDNWDSDGHSHSYNDLDEFIEICIQSDVDVEKVENNYDGAYAKVIKKATDKVRSLRLDLEAEQMLLDQPINTEVKCRLVYWFDN